MRDVERKEGRKWDGEGNEKVLKNSREVTLRDI
jgi:hypothetical protein